MKRLMLFGLLAVVAFGFSPCAARADSLSFTGGFTGNTNNEVHWDLGFPFAVVDSTISTVFLTSLGPGFGYSVNGTLNFETGPQISCTANGLACPPGPAGGLLVATFGAGGSFGITGGIEDLGIPDDTALVAGTFLPGNMASFLLGPLDEDSGTWGPGIDGSFKGKLDITFINPDLLAAFGFPSTWGQGEGSILTTFLNIVWHTDDQGFVSEVDTTVDQSTVKVTPVPESSTLLLLGASLVVAGLFLRKRVFVLHSSH